VRGRIRRGRRRRNCGCSERHDKKEKQKALDTILGQESRERKGLYFIMYIESCVLHKAQGYI